MNIVIYARSAQDHADLDRQLALLIQAISPEDTVMATFSDIASGSGLDRPGLNMALAHLTSGKANAIHVTSPDRLCRSRKKLQELERFLNGRGLGIRVIQTDELQELAEG